MAWEFSFWKPLVVPAARFIGRLHPIRRFRTRVARGKGCFRLPASKIYILVPERSDRTHHFVEANDMRAATELEEMLLRFGYRRGKDWDYYHLRVGTKLPENIRRHNLISICGPSANPFVQELMAEHPDLLSSVYHVESSDRQTRMFRWRNRVYASQDMVDFAYLGVMPNPFNTRRQLIIIYGLRTIGTYGAALLFSASEYSDVRSSLQRESAVNHRKLDVLLYVGGGDTPTQVAVVRAAEPGDGVIEEVSAPGGEKLDSALTLFPAAEYLHRLGVVAKTISEYKRQLHYRKLVFTYTILEDFSYRIDELATFSPVDDDLLVYWKYYGGTVPSASIDSLKFRAEMVETASDQSLTWLPAKNEPLRKEFLVFPLPPMRVGEPERTFLFSAIWPGGAEPLKAPHGRDLFQVLIHRNAASPVISVEVNIQFEAPGTYGVQRVREGISDVADATDRQECRMNQPYRAHFEEVQSGTMYSFHVYRRS